MKKHARTIILMVVAVFVIAALALVTGCGTKEEPAPAGVKPVPNTPPATADDPEAMVKQECSTCHSVDTVYAKKSNDVKEWERTVKRMNEQYGAAVSPENMKIIAEYLADL